jgi:hypothetical protein
MYYFCIVKKIKSMAKLDITKKEKENLIVKCTGGSNRFSIYEIQDSKLNNVLNDIIKNQNKDLLNELINELLKERQDMALYIRNIAQMFCEDLKVERE